MSTENGFINLRLNQEGDSSGHESFWPSFTDIMTVIVMIFLIALVVLLMRNIDLVQQLRNTMEAERMAAELARTTGEEKENLALRLIHTENELSDLRLELMKMQEIREKQLAVIKDNMRQISDLSGQRDRLDLEKTQLQQDKSDLEQRAETLELARAQLDNRLARNQEKLQLSQEQLELLQQSLTALQNKQNQTQSQLTEVQTAFTEKAQELEQALSRITISDDALALLQGDYDDLKIKYDKLVRPARTAAGKQVVEVRYTKLDGKDLIALKVPGQDKFSPVSRKQLLGRLDDLKKKYPKKLYIKVIFPENSGLSYNEAWEFTSSLHKKYDYYFQDE